MKLVCVIALFSSLLTAMSDTGQTEAEKLIEAGHWKKARAIVEARIRQAPDDPLTNFLLSQIRNAFGDYTSPLSLAEKAVAQAERADIHDSRVAKYHGQLAEVLGVQAQHAGPIRILLLARRFRIEVDAAIALDPHDVRAQRDLLEYYLVAPGIAGGDIQKASSIAARIGEQDQAEGLLARARIAAFQKEPGETQALLRQAAHVQPPNWRAHTELANFDLAAEHENPAEAEYIARELLKIDPTRTEPYTILPHIYADRGDWRSLDATLAEASERNPDDLTPWYRAADRLLANGRDPVKAERYLRRYLGSEPEGNEPTAAEARRKLTAVTPSIQRKGIERHGE